MPALTERELRKLVPDLGRGLPEERTLDLVEALETGRYDVDSPDEPALPRRARVRGVL